MNDLIQDINALQKITDNISKNISWNLHVASALSDLRDIISAKKQLVDDFEKQASQDIQDLCNSIRGTKQLHLGQDWEYERGGEQTLYSWEEVQNIENHKRGVK